MPAQVSFVDTVTNAWKRYVDATVIEPPDPPEQFVYEVTEPYNPTPANPPADANVGWDGTYTSILTGDQTVAAGATLKDKIINGYVTLGAGATLENCIVNGRSYQTSISGYIRISSGATVRRCTLIGNSSAVGYWVNGIQLSGSGTTYIDRSVFSGFNDNVHRSSSSAKIYATGNLHLPYAFFDNDADHASGTPPYWTHNDAYQCLGTGGPDVISGDKIISYFNVDGVTWSGGTWGSGTASGGLLGRPSTALNAGYWRAAYLDEGVVGRGTWANGITYSNSSTSTATITGCWIDGVNASSGLMQFTPGTSCTVTLKRNRYGLGGKRSGSGTIYLVSYPSATTTATIGTGADANVYDDLLSVPSD